MHLHQNQTEIEPQSNWFDIDPANPYERIYMDSNNEEKDVLCDICLEYEYEDNDEIIFCDLCNAAAHRTCYGSELIDSIPQG